MTYKLIFIALMLASSTAEAAIYKCTDAHGKTTFSQLPCAPDAQKITVKTTQPSAEEQKRTRETIEKNSAMVKSRESSRRLNAAKNHVQELINERDTKIRLLQYKKLRANNNLAGATWEKSISDEIQAVNQRYNADIDAARQHVRDLENAEHKTTQ